MGIDRLDDQDFPFASVGQAAELLDVQPAFLRSLDTADLLKPQRSEGGHRRYTRRQLRFAAAIRELTTQGHTVASAALIVQLNDDLAIAHEQRRHAEDQQRTPSANSTAPTPGSTPRTAPSTTTTCPDPPTARRTDPAEGGNDPARKRPAVASTSSSTPRRARRVGERVDDSALRAPEGRLYRLLGLLRA